MVSRLTTGLHRVIHLAHGLAHASGSDSAQTEHLFLALLQQDWAPGITELRALNVDVDLLIQRLSRDIRPDLLFQPFSEPFSIRTSSPVKRAIFEIGAREAALFGHNELRTEHVLLALLREKGGVIEQLLADMGYDGDSLYVEIVIRLEGKPD